MIIIKNYNLSKIFIYIIIVELLGFISGFFVGYSKDMYAITEINFYTPPSYIFGIVWTILYAALGFIAYLIFTLGSRNFKIAFIFHMLLNYSWTYFFFAIDSYTIALLVILLMIISLLYIRVWIREISNFTNILCYIYLIWLIYALFLNFMIIM